MLRFVGLHFIFRVLRSLWEWFSPGLHPIRYEKRRRKGLRLHRKMNVGKESFGRRRGPFQATYKIILLLFPKSLSKRATSQTGLGWGRLSRLALNTLTYYFLSLERSEKAY